MYDCIIKNAKIVDGSGMPYYRSEVALKDGKISKIAPFINGEASEIVDAEGLTLTPGFVDSHSHDDFIMETVPSLYHKLEQGVTTEITGMCGHSMAPLSKEFEVEGGRVYDTLCAKGVVKTQATRCDFPTYLRELPDAYGPNIAFHIGHGTVRCAVMGFDHGKASPAQLEKMKDYVRGAMEAGALGISFGLIYNPGVFGDTEECIELCKVAAEYGGDMTIHMRNEGKRLIQAVEETLRIVKESGVRCVISHHKCSGGPDNWHQCRQTIEMIEQANRDGCTIFVDQYPYIASSTGLNNEIPKQYLTLPKDRLYEMIGSPEGIKEIADAMRDGRSDEECYTRLMIGGSLAYPQYSGKMVPEAAEMHGKGRAETILEVLMADDLATTEISFGMCEEDVEYIMAYPRTMIGTDGLWYPGSMGAHPRAFASFPRVLGYYVRERGVMSFEEAIRRMTSMPAAVYGLKNKGLIREGYDADLCLVDPDVIIDAADFVNWSRRCPGLKHVFVAGQPVVTDSIHDGRLLGRKLYRSW